MKTDHNGCSICPVGGERYETFTLFDRGGVRCQYDYRTPAGELFSTVAPTLEQARQRRDRWLEEKAKSDGP